MNEKQKELYIKLLEEKLKKETNGNKAKAIRAIIKVLEKENKNGQNIKSEA